MAGLPESLQFCVGLFFVSEIQYAETFALIIFGFRYLQVNDIACSADVTVTVRTLLGQAEKAWDLTYHCILCLSPH